MRGRRETRFRPRRVAEVEVERAVARHLRVELRRAGSQRLLRPGHRGQGFDIEADRFGGVARGSGRLGDDEGEGIADEAHPVAGERVAGRLSHRRAVPILEGRDDLERPVAPFGEIGGRVDAENARHVPCRGGIDGPDGAVRVGAAHHDGVGLAGQIEIVRVAAFAAHERGIFHARHGLADAEFHHSEFVGRNLRVHRLIQGSLRLSFRG